jgi:hypothetical protein
MIETVCQDKYRAQWLRSKKDNSGVSAETFLLKCLEDHRREVSTDVVQK